MTIPVILDTDIGTDIDDTWALAMLLNCPELEPKLIVTADGDTVYRAHLVAKFLQVAGRTEIPIGIGIAKAGASHRYQEPWLADFDCDAYPGTLYSDGVQALIDVIMTSPAPATVISIGAATNIARALDLEPRIATHARFVGMHGSIYRGYDGTPGATPEANVKSDIPALRTVFVAPWQEIVITPLDTCGLVVLEGERYQEILHSPNPALKALIENYRIWARLVTWMTVDYEDVRSSTLFDTAAIYLAYSQAWLEVTPVRLRVTDEGLTLPDPAGHKVLAALRWRDLAAFYDHLVERLDP
ncbi:MAG: nucleoside hydrolase [Anaerolineae bacterium]|nr:nucleoside hydrolase [Anaerolineae bacterium]